jgi:hypothetical protein
MNKNSAKNRLPDEVANWERRSNLPPLKLVRDHKIDKEIHTFGVYIMRFSNGGRGPLGSSNIMSPAPSGTLA